MEGWSILNESKQGFSIFGFIYGRITIID